MGLMSGLCGCQSLYENDSLMHPEPLFHNLNLMNNGTVIWEYACAIREEEIN